MDGTVSQRHPVGPPLFVDPQFDEEADGDVYPFPGGFMGVIEGECVGHSCSYAFKLDTNGAPIGASMNIVDFDLTHQFYPSAAYDGSRLHDAHREGHRHRQRRRDDEVLERRRPAQQQPQGRAEQVSISGTSSRISPTTATTTPRCGRRTRRARTRQPWQIHFATFHRTNNSSTPIADRIIDIVSQKTNHRWTTQVHQMGGEWVAQYASRAPDNSIVAVYELLGDDAQTGIYLEPFPLTADALGSSRHTAAGVFGVLGIARGSVVGDGTTIEFYTLAPPSCQ